MNSLFDIQLNSIGKSSMDQIINSNNDCDDKENMSLDFLFDTFQNLILDCKSITNTASNKYLLNFYRQYQDIYDKLYNHRMKYDDFNVLKIIGQGAFGQVQLVRHRQTGDLYALKILNKSQVITCEGTIFWQEEREIMIKIDSRWIVKLHYAFQDPKRLYMVMDYLPGGNLVNWMSKLEVLLENDVRFYAAEIVLAINGLHHFGFVHRDIKPDNLLFDNIGHIKLADFGSCVKMDPVTKYVNCNRAIGTPDYISPEVLLSQSNNSKYGKEVDWWALGVMLYEIFYGEPPFYSDNLINTYGKIMTHEQSLSFPADDEVSDTALDFMKNLICDRSVRLGQTNDACDIKSHEFFAPNNRKWNWENIQEFPPPFIPIFENDLDTSYFDFGDDDVDMNFMTQSNQELKSTNFVGENLQFSGFSYTRYGIDSTKKDSNIDNEAMDDKLININKENQSNKDALDKLLIEKRDLETQLSIISNNFKKEENVSKKLQFDYSELMTKHSNCQKKIQDLEESKLKLSADLVKLQSSSDKEKEILLSDINRLDKHLKTSNIKLMEIQTSYHQSKMNSSKLESERNKLQETCHSLESEVAHLKNGGIKQNNDLSSDNESEDYHKLQMEFDGKLKDLNKSLNDNKSLMKSIENLEKEKNKLNISLMELESRFIRELQTNRKQVVEIKEKDDLINAMKNQMEKLQKSVESGLKNEVNTNLKMSKLLQSKMSDKQKYEQELEEQRNKLSKIITTKTFEIQQIKTSCENLTESNAKLMSQVELDKSKQEALVEKINEIIHGKCTTAKEMMISEDAKSGVISKRSSRRYHQLAKETKRMESMYDELQKNSKIKEAELKRQIEALTKEKDQLHDRITFIENLHNTETANNRASVSTIASSHSSFDSGLPGEPTHDSTNVFRRPFKKPLGKPPMLNHLSSIKSLNYSSKSQDLTSDVFEDSNDDQTEIKLRQKRASTIDNRQSKGESISMEIPNMENYLEVNVKVKGKKMSWEKRFVKYDDQNIYFYGQDMETLHLTLLMSSLIFVRPASSADVIHAKKSEIPRIFQICYDKNETYFLRAQHLKSISRSINSINSVGSSKSLKTNSSNENETHAHHDYVDRKASSNRKGSLTRFIPIFGNKVLKSKENEEFLLNYVDGSTIFLKGHLFMSSYIEGKLKCDLCTKANDTKLINSTSRLLSDNLHQNDVPANLSMEKIYQCYHCSIKAHGYDLDSKLYTCKQSVAIQLCRTSTDVDQKNWIKFINQFVPGTLNKNINPGLSSPVIKDRIGSCFN